MRNFALAWCVAVAWFATWPVTVFVFATVTENRWWLVAVFAGWVAVGSASYARGYYLVNRAEGDGRGER